jgi:hypothetical protein
MIFLYKHTGNLGTERNFWVSVPFRQKPENGNGTEQPPLGGVPSSLEDARDFHAASAVVARITLGKVVGAFLPLLFRAGMMQALPV